jgi:hypothetical protein
MPSSSLAIPVLLIHWSTNIIRLVIIPTSEFNFNSKKFKLINLF